MNYSNEMSSYLSKEVVESIAVLTRYSYFILMQFTFGRFHLAFYTYVTFRRNNNSGYNDKRWNVLIVSTTYS